MILEYAMVVIEKMCAIGIQCPALLFGRYDVVGAGFLSVANAAMVAIFIYYRQNNGIWHLFIL